MVYCTNRVAARHQTPPNTASRKYTGIMHPNPKEHRGRWWESARFHLCLRQGAGRQFAWLGVGSVKSALSCPAHQRVTHTERATFDPPRLQFPPLLRMELNQSSEAFNTYSSSNSRAAVVRLLSYEKIGGRT